MGTCFTSTRHVSGRQQKSEHRSGQRTSQLPFRQSDLDNPSRRQIPVQPLLPPSSTRQYNYLTNNLANIHGNNGAQSSYNRYVCRKQKTCGPSTDPTRTFDVSLGRNNVLNTKIKFMENNALIIF